MDSELNRARSKRRSVESAVLAIVVESHPEPLSRLTLLNEMEASPDDSDRIAAVDDAVDGLIAVGLLTKESQTLSPTPASLRAAELELGF